MSNNDQENDKTKEPKVGPFTNFRDLLLRGHEGKFSRLTKNQTILPTDMEVTDDTIKLVPQSKVGKTITPEDVILRLNIGQARRMVDFQL